MKAKLKRGGKFGDTAEFSFDFYTKVAGQAGHPLRIFSAMIDPNNPPPPSWTYKNELIYTPSTLTEWVCAGDSYVSNGDIVLTRVSVVSRAGIYTNLKPSTKYGILCYVDSTNVTTSTPIYFSYDAFNNEDMGVYCTNLFTGIGNRKFIATTLSSITYNCLQFRAYPATEVKFKNVRVFELPVGSGIENDFDTMTADQLATKYNFDSTGATQTAMFGIEIVKQATIDQLKEQNELPITSVDYAGKTAVYNGQTYIQQGLNNVAVRDDFAHKVAGVTTGLTVSDHCPHYIKTIKSSTLQTPANFITELIQAEYDKQMTLDGICSSLTATANGDIPQRSIAYNIVAMWEDKFGPIPGAVTLADKVAYLRSTVSYLALNAYIYGVCPYGNKAYLKVWLVNTNAWSTGNTITSATPALTSNVTTVNIPLIINDDGFAYFSVTTDAASTTSPTLLVLTGHGLSNLDIFENVTRNSGGLLVSNAIVNAFTTPSITGQIAGDVINKYKYNRSTTAGAGTTETTIVINNHGLSTGDYVKNYTRSSIRLKITVIDANTFTIDKTVTGQVAGDSIGLYPFLGQQAAEATVIPSTIYLDYCYIDIQAKVPTGYIGLVSPTPRRDAGLANVLFMTADYRAEETDSNIVYGGNWSISSSSNYSNGSLKYAKTTGFYAEFTFVGTGIRWIGSQRNTYGYANVTIDGGVPVQVDCYVANVVYQTVLFERTDLTYGQHTIRIDVLGISNPLSTDVIITLDAFDVLNTNTQVTEMYTGNSIELESLTSGKVPAYMAECSLQAIADAEFGGSNAALKAALLGAVFRAYATGQGALNSTLGYGCGLSVYASGTGWFALTMYQNTTPAIASISYSPTQANTQNKLSLDNKFFVLIAAQKPSDGTIPSSLSLDYMSIKLQLTRSPDIAVSKPIYLPQYYAFTLQGFASVYDASNAVKTRVLLHIQKNADNYIQLNFDAAAKKFNFVKCIAGIITTLSNNAQSFNKYQVHSIAIAQTTAGMVLLLLKNGGAVEKYTNADVALLTGTCSLYLLTREVSGSEADAFYFRLKKEDLLSKGWQDAIPDDVVDGILKGTCAGYQFPVLSGTLMIYPNNKYHVEGSADIYINGYKTRTVTTGDFTATAYENKAVIADGSILKLVM